MDWKKLYDNSKARVGWVTVALGLIKFGLDSISRVQTALLIVPVIGGFLAKNWGTILVLVVGLGIILWSVRGKPTPKAVIDRGSEDRELAAQRIPQIAAHFIRSHLMPRSAFQNMYNQVMKHAGRPEYEVECDLMYEIFLVNTSDNPVTIRKFLGEAQFGNEWKPLKQIDDLTDYQIQRGEEPNSPRKDLVSVSKLLEGVPLTTGIGYRGWLRFELVANNVMLENKVMSRVSIVDALGGTHGVSQSEPFDTSEGALIHNPARIFN